MTESYRWPDVWRGLGYTKGFELLDDQKILGDWMVRMTGILPGVVGDSRGF